MGILQARILEWVTMPSSRGSSWPKEWTQVSYVSCICMRVLYHWHYLESTGQKCYTGKIKPSQGHYGLLMPVCVLYTNLWAQLKFSGRESGWVGFSPLTPSTLAMVHCLPSRECGENSLRSRCGQACGDEHISEKRSKDWGYSLRAASLWMTETLKANVSETW